MKVFKYMQIIILFLTINTVVTYGVDYNTYPQYVVKTFKWGTGDGEFGKPYRTNPTAFAFDKDEKMYVCDIVNKRISLFDNNYDFIKSIYPSENFSMSRIYIDDMDSNIVGIGNTSISKMNTNGNVLYFINLMTFSEGKGVKTLKTIISNNKIYLEKDKEMYLLENPESVTKENFKLKKVESSDELSASSRTSLHDSSDGIEVDDKKRLFKGGKFITRDFKSFRSYHKEKKEEKVKNNLSIKASVNDSSKKIEEFKTGIDISKLDGIVYLGKDNDGNEYWGSTFLVLVYTEGILIDMFLPEPQKSITLPAIHPSGDVYYIYSDNEKVYLARVKRVWGLEEE